MRYPKRKPMKQWIKEKLDSKSYPGLRWIDKKRGKFEISWKHGSLQNWSYEEDVLVFREWAVYTGKYQPHNNATTEEDLELAKKWKTNFRCALNALPGLEMVKEESSARGADARKVYIMKLDKMTRRKQKYKEQVPALEIEPLSPLSRGIDQQDIDEIEKELSQYPKVFKKEETDFGFHEVQDLLHNGDLFHE